MIKIGITGIIGSGKSIVSKIFETFSIPVYYADIEAKILMSSNQEIITALKSKYGDSIYQNNQINKKLLTSIIFNNNNERLFINSIVHPIVVNDFINWTQNQNKKALAIEAALIYETDLKNFLDITCEVKSPEHLLIQRIVNRDKISIQDAINKINVQKNIFLNSKPDYVIINDENNSLIEQIYDFLLNLNLIE